MAKSKLSTTERFFRFVQKTDTCWMWTGTTLSFGYGHFRGDNKKLILAHRFSWQMSHGPIAENMCVLHKCDVPSCVNPSHLFIGTRADNVADMMSKGRHVARSGDQNGARLHPERILRRERHPASKVTPESASQIKAIYLDGNHSQTEIGNMFSLSQQTVSNVICGKWD